MFLVGLLSWWYRGGLYSRCQLIQNRLQSSADFFSIGLLVETLFAPFRQISADSTSGSLSAQIQAFFDKLLSRFIGAIMRFSMILFGLIFITLQTIFGIIVMIFWLIIPLLPAVGLIGMAIGLVPQWIK